MINHARKRGMPMVSTRSGALEGKVALITGAATGIGRASAVLFAREGARVILVDLRLPELEEAVAAVREAGGRNEAATYVVADLSDPEACASAVEQGVQTYGRLDILFNNAGVGTLWVGGTVETIDLEHWDQALDVNVRAMYLVSKAAVPHLRAAGGGAIVNTASVAALRSSRPRPSHAYAASKGAVLSLTRAMAVSYGKDRIRVNAICPGLIRTRLTVDIVEAAENAAAEDDGIPIGRVGEPDDIARCALFLASDASSFITGTQIVVDGGATALAV
jgi:NAD(P)-dependent dehydrogenase (short-subunit alcohol dehydrogenase family)